MLSTIILNMEWWHICLILNGLCWLPTFGYHRKDIFDGVAEFFFAIFATLVIWLIYFIIN